jgi:signal transduction histidine kinase
MSEEVNRQCVEPYFSTKPRGVSTGMGLAFVHGLVTGLGGKVEIDAMANASALDRARYFGARYTPRRTPGDRPIPGPAATPRGHSPLRATP